MNSCDYCGNIFNYYPSQHRYYSTKCKQQYAEDKQKNKLLTLQERITFLHKQRLKLQPKNESQKLYSKIHRFLQQDEKEKYLHQSF